MKKKILLVDDEELILSALSADLSDNNFEVVTVNNVKKGISKIKKGHFDLLISDLSMEGLTGLDMLKAAKEIHPEISVIILTGYGTLDSAINALRLGADDYLLKPCNLEEMLLRIEKCLEKQEFKAKIQVYETLLPVCCMCKKIRDDSDKESDSGKWMGYEEYLANKTGVNFTHGYCPECYEKAIKTL